MRAFLTMSANRAVDEYAINNCGIPGETLMLNAGRATVHQMEKVGLLKLASDVVVLAGHGNNGGDGYVIASHLHQRGMSVKVILVGEPGKLKGDALSHFRNMENAGVYLSVWDDTTLQHDLILKADVLVDALLGTGIKGEIRAPYVTLINLINQSAGRVLAVDVPSGMTGDSGAILEPCVKADFTVSMGYGKQGCLFEPAKSRSGRISIVEIGFPTDSLDHIDGEVLNQLEDLDFSASRYSRPSDAHKYSSGKVYIIAGSRGLSGAALLASTAALRSGAGLVKLGIPESLGPIAESLSLETMIEYLPETEAQSLAQTGLASLISGAEWADTVVIGPGLGRHPETMILARELIEKIEKPLVIDADALFALSENPEMLLSRKYPTLITPHLGEFKRLSAAEDNHTPTWVDAQAFALKYKVNVLLKGAPSIMVSPEGMVHVNSTGYAGMATAGSGDVLSGVCASLWSQWLDDSRVLEFAMYTHGSAADNMRSEKGVLGLIASDIVAGLPQALKEYGDIPT